MPKKRKNQDLKKLYNRTFKRGRDTFFTFKTDYITREILENINFKGKTVLEKVSEYNHELPHSGIKEFYILTKN